MTGPISSSSTSTVCRPTARSTAATMHTAISESRNTPRPSRTPPVSVCEPNPPLRLLRGPAHLYTRTGMHDFDRDPQGVIRVRAANPSALTLDGTNTYVVGAWVVDPGPADPAHVEALRDVAQGSIEGVVLTHSHADHAEGAAMLGA